MVLFYSNMNTWKKKSSWFKIHLVAFWSVSLEMNQYEPVSTAEAVPFAEENCETWLKAQEKLISGPLIDYFVTHTDYHGQN